MRAAGVSSSLVVALGLAGCSGPSSGQPAAAASAPSDLGADIYGRNCAPCHQDDGKGIPAVYPGLGGSPVVIGDPVELGRWVLSGTRPRSMPAGRYSTRMLAFGWMKDADAAALLTYIRSHFGNSAPAVDTATVADIRP